MTNRVTAIEFIGIGWKSSIQDKRGTKRWHIKKDIATGLSLKKGDHSYGYLMKDLNSNRPMVGFYVDGKPRDGEEDEWH